MSVRASISVGVERHGRVVHAVRFEVMVSPENEIRRVHERIIATCINHMFEFFIYVVVGVIEECF